MEGAELAEFAGFFGLGAASGALGSAFFTAFGAAGGAGAGFEGFFAGAVLGSSFLASGRFFVLIGVDLAVFLVFAADLVVREPPVEDFKLLVSEDLERLAVLDLPRIGLKAGGI